MRIGNYLAILTFIAILVQTIALIMTRDDRELWDLQTLKDLLKGLLLALFVKFLAYPKGLPLAVVSSVSSAAKNMMKDSCLVK